ncbi:hypothetical protein BB559_006812 [Furculomyces boomerangus]|uniref:Tyrosinase copper-binding domain-containing protein n=2 Tax=Furculomyces boomerangus TaxID=61424 RepID=A0A2T9Y0C2_9FUNG|nr:hypothetical protein BB559_006812 [Furculomyces boomerangus]
MLFLKLIVFFISSLLANSQNVPNPQLDDSVCNGLVVRKELSTMTSSEWNRFASANRIMYQRGWFTGLAQIHNDYAMEIHGSGFFFPWHRRFVTHYQLLLQRIDPNIVIPYWDWTSNWNAPERNIALSPSMFGGNGRGSQRCVRDGISANWERTLPSSQCITRNYRNGNTPGPFWPPDAVGQVISQNTRFSTFSRNIENGCHGNVHIGIGGDFLEMWAPNDPLFFMHHAMVDRIWSVWQEANQRRYNDISSTTFDGNPIDMNSILPYYNEPISMSISMRSSGHCYTYDNLATSSFRDLRTKNSNNTYSNGDGIPIKHCKDIPEQHYPTVVINNKTAMFNFDKDVVDNMNAFVRKVVNNLSGCK